MFGQNDTLCEKFALELDFFLLLLKISQKKFQSQRSNQVSYLPNLDEMLIMSMSIRRGDIGDVTHFLVNIILL